MKYVKPLALSLLLCGSASAKNISVVGSHTENVKLPVAKNVKMAVPKTKIIALLDITLSDKAKSHLVKHAKLSLTQPAKKLGTKLPYNLPEQMQLEMNDVPVLDQGQHGSCVMFANTAAIDAALRKGDYISQLCQLQLGSYVEKNGYLPSGWNGSLGRETLGMLETFGFVNKDQQQTQGCGGLTEYPTNDEYPTDSFITPEEFHGMSESLLNDDSEETSVTWSSLLDVNQAFSDRIDTNDTLNEVKKALSTGDRLTFGALLWDVDLGLVGAVGSHRAEQDTWVLTPEIARDTYSRAVYGGHEMVITGYDDQAIAVDDKGRSHQGLLTLRNSWGDEVGDHGTFYMSYDYFKLFVIEVNRIRASAIEDGK